jgi:hypothetical protein
MDTIDLTKRQEDGKDDVIWLVYRLQRAKSHGKTKMKAMAKIEIWSLAIENGVNAKKCP